MVAGPSPRLSAWMTVEKSVPMEDHPRTVIAHLCRRGRVRACRTIAHIALVLWVPTTLTAVFVALIVASPLACIRSPDLLASPGLAVLSMNELLTIRLASAGVVPPWCSSRLTESTVAEPAWMTTLIARLKRDEDRSNDLYE